MEEPHSDSPATNPSLPTDGSPQPDSMQRSQTSVPWFRAALTVVVLIAALSVLLAHEAPTLLPTARDRLFPPPTPVPTATPVPTVAVADVLRARPLRFPVLASRSHCPTMLGRTVDPDLVEVVGAGPVYVALGVEDTLYYAPAKNFGSEEWGGQKTLWALPQGFAGMVLVRGRQLDGPNEVRFGRGDVPSAELLFLGPGEAQSDPPNGWTYEIDYTRVRAPGCYAYQIDSETYSDVLIFQAEPLVGWAPQ